MKLRGLNQRYSTDYVGAVRERSRLYIPVPLLYLLQWLKRSSQSRDDTDADSFRIDDKIH